MNHELSFEKTNEWVVPFDFVLIEDPSNLTSDLSTSFTEASTVGSTTG